MALKKLRLFYAAGPGDIIGTFRYWQQKKADPSYLGITDSGQFYDLVQELNAEALLIASCQRVDEVREGPFTIKHIPGLGGSGLAYHVNQVSYGIRMCYEAIRYKADYAVIEEGTSHWFVWNILNWFGIKAIPSLKCLFWPEFRPLSRKQKILNFMNRSFFRKKAQAILSMSDVIQKQALEITGAEHPPAMTFLPIYKKEVFDPIAPPRIADRPFNVLFIGRLETYKGVFDLVEIAKKFNRMGIHDIHFDFCGTGSEAEKLEASIKENHLEDTCHLHGYCNREKLISIFSKSHVVIAPSRTSFIEGFCMVVVEGILAGRPVISSKVCPSIYTVPDGVCEAKPDDVENYAELILKLYNSPSFYEEKQRGCVKASLPFYDPENSWGAAVKKSIF